MDGFMVILFLISNLLFITIGICLKHSNLHNVGNLTALVLGLLFLQHRLQYRNQMLATLIVGCLLALYVVVATSTESQESKTYSFGIIAVFSLSCSTVVVLFIKCLRDAEIYRHEAGFLDGGVDPLLQFLQEFLGYDVIPIQEIRFVPAQMPAAQIPIPNAVNDEIQILDPDLSHVANGDPVCPVCLQEFVMEIEATQLGCNHTFHSHCIRRWLAGHHSCPICRMVV